VALAVGLTWWVIARAEPARVGAALQGVSWTWVIAAIALVLIDRTLNAFRWISLLAPLDPGQRPPFRSVLRIFFVSSFIGSFLPSVGGDAVRTFGLARDGVSVSQSLASVLMDRLLGVLAIVGTAVLGLALAPDLLGDTVVRWALGLGIAGCVLGGAFVFSVRLDEALRRWLSTWAPGWRRQALQRVLAAIRAYDRHRRVLVVVLLASVGVQVLRILQAWLLGRGLGIEAPLAVYLAFVPVILLVMQLPITVSGLGTSQWAFQALFARAGVAAPAAVALSLLFVALGLVGNIPGLAYYVAGSRDGARVGQRTS
jgi:glycosyltransferase 2 family protein